MEAAWREANEYDARVNLNSLYTNKIVSATKLNDVMNDLSESGDPSDQPSDPDHLHPDAAVGSPSAGRGGLAGEVAHDARRGSGARARAVCVCGSEASARAVNPRFCPKSRHHNSALLQG
jgi:hypothetical protein